VGEVPSYLKTEASSRGSGLTGKHAAVAGSFTLMATTSKACFQTTKPMDSEYISMLMILSTLENGRMTNSTVKELRNGQMEASTSEILSSGSSRVPGSSVGPMVRLTREIFAITRFKALESTHGLILGAISDTGSTTRCTAMEISYGPTEKHSKDSINET